MNQDQRRPRRPVAPARPNLNSTTSIVVAVAAVILGFLILRDINGDNSSTSNPTDAGIAQPTDSVAPTDTIPVETTVDTTIPLTNFKVQIANASKVPGSAGELTTALQGRGFIVQPATNASEITPKQTQTVVTTAAMPAPIPTESGELGEATVLILLGTDLAGKPLATPVSG